MGIFKKGYYNTSAIAPLKIDDINLKEDADLEKVSFNKEEYLSILEKAKKEGFEEGKKEGFDFGYNESQKIIKQEKEQLKESLNQDMENISKHLEKLGIEYLSSLNSDIISIINNSINKIFFNAIDSDIVMRNYLSNLIDNLNSKYKEYTISCNQHTSKIIATICDTISVKENNSLDNFDIIVNSPIESAEFFLKDEIAKLNSLFDR